MKKINAVYALLACLFISSGSVLMAVEAGEERAIPLRTVAPDYPTNLRQAGVEGLVVVKVSIDEKGSPVDVSVSKSTNDKLDVYAVKAVKRWTFKPAKKNGEAVATVATIPIQFSVES